MWPDLKNVAAAKIRMAALTNKAMFKAIDMALNGSSEDQVIEKLSLSSRAFKKWKTDNPEFKKAEILAGDDIIPLRNTNQATLDVVKQFPSTSQTPIIEKTIENLTTENYYRGIDPSRTADFDVCAFVLKLEKVM